MLTHQFYDSQIYASRTHIMMNLPVKALTLRMPSLKAYVHSSQHFSALKTLYETVRLLLYTESLSYKETSWKVLK